MRGVFDEREAERDRRKRGREKRDRDDGHGEKRDREVTLGSFTLLAILFALVMLCGLSFSLGYVVGRREPAAKSTVLEPTPIAAQGDSAKSKPTGGSGGGSGSVGGQTAEAQSVQGGEAGGLHQANDAAASIAGAGVTDNSKGMQQAAQSGASTALVHSALPEVASVSKAQQIQSKVQPALEPAGKKAQAAAPLALMVQVATLAHQEDADVLVQALRRRGYAVGANRDPADGMVHVRVGPFASRDVANQWRQKLQNDGYNAVVESQ